MKNTLILICILCFCSTLTCAQDSTSTKKRFYISAGFGSQWMQAEGFNKKLTEAGFNSFNTNALCGQAIIGVSGKKHNLMLVLGIAYAPRNTNSDNSKTTGFSQFRTDILYGYEFNLSKRFILMPMAGINTQANTISVQKNINTITFGSALSNPIATGTTITSESFGATVGTRLILKSGKKSAISLNLMYTLPISNYNWKSNGQELKDAPKVNLGGFSLGLGYGLR